jgi:hypothetical protein
MLASIKEVKRGKRAANTARKLDQAAALSAAFCVAKAKSSQGCQRLDISRLDRRAAPDAQARRGIAIGADVVGDAFLFELRGNQPWRRPPCCSLSSAVTCPDRRSQGTPRCWIASPELGKVRQPVGLDRQSR